MASLIKQLQKMKTKALLNYLLTKNTFLKIVHLLVVVATLNFLSDTEAHLGTYSSFEKNSLKNVYFCLYGHQYSDLSKLHLLEFRLSLQFSLFYMTTTRQLNQVLQCRNTTSRPSFIFTCQQRISFRFQKHTAQSGLTIRKKCNLKSKLNCLP